MKHFPLQTVFFFHGYAPLQTFFLEKQTNFFKHIIFASNLFCLFRPWKQFFQYFSYLPLPPHFRKIMVRPLASKAQFDPSEDSWFSGNRETHCVITQITEVICKFLILNSLFPLFSAA